MFLIYDHKKGIWNKRKAYLVLNSFDARDGIFWLIGNIMPADALATTAARASAGTVLIMWGKQHVVLLLREFHMFFRFNFVSNRIQEIIQNVNVSPIT